MFVIVSLLDDGSDDDRVCRCSRCCWCLLRLEFATEWINEDDDFGDDETNVRSLLLRKERNDVIVVVLVAVIMVFIVLL